MRKELAHTPEYSPVGLRGLCLSGKMQDAIALMISLIYKRVPFLLNRMRIVSVTSKSPEGDVMRMVE